MILEDLKAQALTLMETFGPMSNVARTRQLSKEDLGDNARKIARTMSKDPEKGCWLLLFHRLCKTKGFVVVEIKTTKSVFYSAHFEAFYNFCKK